MTCSVLDWIMDWNINWKYGLNFSSFWEHAKNCSGVGALIATQESPQQLVLPHPSLAYHRCITCAGCINTPVLGAAGINKTKGTWMGEGGGGGGGSVQECGKASL